MYPYSQNAYDNFRQELPRDLMKYKDLRKMAFPINKCYMKHQDIYEHPIFMTKGNQTNRGRTFNLHNHRVLLNSYPDYVDNIYYKKKRYNYCDMYRLLPRDPGTNFSFFYNWI